MVRLQLGESASVTETFVSSTSPAFRTVIVKTAVPPGAIVCDFGFFVIEIAGCAAAGGGGGRGSVTDTCTESLAVTSTPAGEVPVATATLSNGAVTDDREHV